MNGGRNPPKPLLVVVTRLPAPYREPLFQRIADDGRIDIHVLYQVEGRAGTAWATEPCRTERSLGYARESMAPTKGGPIQAPWSYHRILRRLGDLAPDLVLIHGYSFAGSWAAIRFCRKTKTPYALRSDSNAYIAGSGKLKRAIKSRCLGALVRNAQSILYIGSANRLYWREYGASENQLIEARYAVDDKIFSPSSDEFVAGKGVKFLFVGRLVPRKNILKLIRAFGSLAAADSSVFLTIVGTGPQERQARALIDENSYRSIEFKGRCKPAEMPAIYRAHDVLVCPYESEPWGLTINEAMSCGLAVIADSTGACGAAVDLLIDGCNGIGLNDLTTGNIAAAMHAIANDRNRLADMKRASLEIVRGWTYDSAVEGFVEAAFRTSSPA